MLLLAKPLVILVRNHAFLELGARARSVYMYVLVQGLDIVGVSMIL